MFQKVARLRAILPSLGIRFSPYLLSEMENTPWIDVKPIVPYRLVDIGANLAHPGFQHDYEQVLSRAREAGLVKIMITGCSIESSVEASKRADRDPGFLYCTAGVHPHDAKTFNEGTTSELRKLLAKDTCVAVGECGLDFNRNFSPREDQLHAFEEQLKLACELQKPLFIHEREGSTEMIALLEKYGDRLPPAVIHCFTGTAEEAKKYIDMGLYIGLTGFLWKDRSPDGVRYALEKGIIPLDRLLLETDAPYMYPKINDKKVPAEVRESFTSETKEIHRHASFNRNEPCSLAATCEMIAAFMKEEPVKVAAATTENARRVYGLNLD